jgi:hypothetical protein
MGLQEVSTVVNEIRDGCVQGFEDELGSLQVEMGSGSKIRKLAEPDPRFSLRYNKI